MQRVHHLWGGGRSRQEEVRKWGEGKGVPDIKLQPSRWEARSRSEHVRMEFVAHCRCGRRPHLARIAPHATGVLQLHGRLHGIHSAP